MNYASALEFNFEPPESIVSRLVCYLDEWYNNYNFNSHNILSTRTNYHSWRDIFHSEKKLNQALGCIIKHRKTTNLDIIYGIKIENKGDARTVCMNEHYKEVAANKKRMISEWTETIQESILTNNSNNNYDNNNNTTTTTNITTTTTTTTTTTSTTTTSTTTNINCTHQSPYSPNITSYTKVHVTSTKADPTTWSY